MDFDVGFAVAKSRRKDTRFVLSNGVAYSERRNLHIYAFIREIMNHAGSIRKYCFSKWNVEQAFFITKLGFAITEQAFANIESSK